MIPFSAFITVLLSSIFLCSCQDVYVPLVYNGSNNIYRSNNRGPVDSDESLHQNLWLISRDDPIPVSLDRELSTSDFIQTGRVENIESNVYGTRLSAPMNGNIRNTDVSGLPISFLPQGPSHYERIVTSENRRLRTDNDNAGVRNSVVVELPVKLTEGLWVRPQYQELQQPVNARQNTDDKIADIKYDTLENSQRRDEASVFLPVRELDSRLPYDEFSPLSESNLPQDQYPSLPYPILSQIFEGLGASSGNSSDFSSPGIFVINNDQNSHSQAKTNFSNEFYNLRPTDSAEIGRNVYESQVLTSEDIELLERLGILSAVIIEPVHPENYTNSTTYFRNARNENENEPVLIDSGGQRHLSYTSRQDSSKLDDVVFIDIPNFTPSGYHTDLPENSGTEENFNTSHGTSEENGSQSSVSSNQSYVPSNDTNLTDRQILEILQILSLNGGYYNLSNPEHVYSKALQQAPAEKLENSTTENPSNFTSSPSEIPKLTQSPDTSESKHSLRDTSNKNSYSHSASEQRPPTVSNGRIQPRLLEKLTKSDNEIMEALLRRAIPLSDTKLNLLKKLQIQPKPYDFGFKQDDGNGTLQHRNEKSDAAGVVRGTYGYRDAIGVYRNVSYIADKDGFHAVVKTNEPGTFSHNAADVVFMSETPPLSALVKMMAYRRPSGLLNITQLP